MAVQKRNDELVDILSADFPRKDNPHGFWHGHRVNVPIEFELDIPEEIQVLVWGEFTVAGALNIDGELVVI